MHKIYLNNWDIGTVEECRAQMMEDFEITEADMKGVTIILASYEDDGRYGGGAFILFEKGGKYYEVNGGHCSCYGLEDQWHPEEVVFEELYNRILAGTLGDTNKTDYYIQLFNILNRTTGNNTLFKIVLTKENDYRIARKVGKMFGRQKYQIYFGKINYTEDSAVFKVYEDIEMFSFNDIKTNDNLHELLVIGSEFIFIDDNTLYYKQSPGSPLLDCKFVKASVC